MVVITTLLFILTFLSGTFSLNVLIVSIGAAGHVIPLFELAKGMHNHNVTFVTEAQAQPYINVESHPNISSLRLIYLNNSMDTLDMHTKKMQEFVNYAINHSSFDNFAYVITEVSDSISGLMNKTVHLVMEEQYDVIVGTTLTVGMHALCNDANIPCVMQLAEKDPNMFDVNLPYSYSLLSGEQLSTFKYRIYNIAFTIRMIASVFTKLISLLSTLIQSLPQVPGPFYDTFTWKNILLTKSKCLTLYSIPPTLYLPSDLSHSSKYLGAFIDESSIKNADNDLTKWIESKPEKSIIYVAFGSVSTVNLDRMKSLIYGLAEFLLQTDCSSILLAFRNTNAEYYETVLTKITNENYRNILMDKQRVRIENQFIQQKWILQQNSVHLFISHCGMGSIVEALFYQKPILCLPLCLDQFANAIAIEHSGAGESLFQRPSILRSFQNPVAYHEYTFTTTDVTTKLKTMWRNVTYEEIVRIMSLEMKHAGGVTQAVKEIELFVSLKGDLSRYAPFRSTLQFYQRYMIDLMIIYIILPMLIVVYLFKRCCKRTQKQKID
ncbi:unnamed protein product [Adineta steineri]|uniref:Glucuronosyltransferase n=1 Tax=Adineta steineri TaxID=433720 RepID=A0A816EGR7_9BILA|nr:unnamed protein product [Adineta steineri]CAF1421126.1 unnamed protein product [Adineta steineri]CAF1507475.1 unnamed protein product [Adineta steineri]CAF1646326.1 unnamed protein product [Adineta steineri]